MDQAPRSSTACASRGHFRAHCRVPPLGNVRGGPEHLRMLEAWMKSYAPRTLFDKDGRLVPDLAALAQKGGKAAGALRTRSANSGSVVVPLATADFTSAAVRRRSLPGRSIAGSTRQLKVRCSAISTTKNAAAKKLPASSVPTRPTQNRLGIAVFDRRESNNSSSQPSDFDDHVSSDGRVMEVLSEHNCRGLAGRLLAHPAATISSRPTKRSRSSSPRWQRSTPSGSGSAKGLPWRKPVSSLNYPSDVDVLA